MWYKVGECGRLILDCGKEGQSMFMGEFQHNVDTKGRLIMPAKFRQELGDTFVVTRGMDGCLFVFPDEEWKKLEAKLSELPLAKKDARAFVRFFYSAATEVSLDKQGRIKLPQTLMNHASITKECAVIGVSNRIEIWDANRWNDFSDAAEENFDDIAENMMDFDF